MNALVAARQGQIRRALVQALTERRHEVEVAGDAEAAWGACQEGDIPLLLLDRDLPGAEGLEISRRLQARPGGYPGAILVLMDRARPEDVKAVFEAGATDCVVKPLDAAWLGIRLACAERQVIDRASVRRRVP